MPRAALGLKPSPGIVCRLLGGASRLPARSHESIYLKEMMGELARLPNPNGGGGSLVDAIDLVVPNQANKNMVLTLAEQAGISGDRIVEVIPFRRLA